MKFWQPSLQAQLKSMPKMSLQQDRFKVKSLQTNLKYTSKDRVEQWVLTWRSSVKPRLKLMLRFEAKSCAARNVSQRS